MKKNKYITFGSPMIGKAEINAVSAVLRSGWLGTGPKTIEFEEIIKVYVGSNYAVALNSCTAGLHLSLLVAGVGPGDEVITTPLTFAATANAIIHVGANPVFVDIKEDTMNIDEDKIEQAITKKTKAIIPVHFAGRPCEMDKIMNIAKKNNLVVIEDAAHAIGAEYNGHKIGSIGDLSCFSFYVTKNIVTGEGGMVTTNNKDYADKIKTYALHGMSRDAWKRYSDNGYKHYEVVVPGFKYNMMDIQAAIGLEQMKKINRYAERREKIWKTYLKEFSKLPVTLPTPDRPNTKHARHLFTILINKERSGLSRDEFMSKLHQAGIGTGVHFLPIHGHDFYRKKFNHKKGDYPIAEKIGQETVSIPISAKLTDSQVEYIVKTIKSLFRPKK